MSDSSQFSLATTPLVDTVKLRRRYPAAVDGVTVRLVASAVLLVGVVAIASGQWWLYLLLAADFVPRFVWGPSRSIIATAILRFVRPRVPLAPRSVSGAPKRFAAGIGAVMTSLASVAWLLHLALGSHAALVAVWVIAGMMVVFPALEAVFGYCVGCKIYGLLARRGWVNPDLCVDCLS